MLQNLTTKWVFLYNIDRYNKYTHTHTYQLITLINPFSDGFVWVVNCQIIIIMWFRESKIPDMPPLVTSWNLNPKDGIKYLTDLGHQEDALLKVL